ncbi:MAG TPA: AMP-binding protein [Longimicrobium sp.]
MTRPLAHGGRGMMGPLAHALHRSVVYPLATRLRGEGRVAAYLRELREVERLDPAALLRRQDEKLARLLAWAAAESPWYGARIPAGVTAANAREVLAALPLLEKRTVQEHGAELRCRGFTGRVTAKSTGGSTGAPVRVDKGADGVARERAVTWMALGWFGIGPGDRVARFWGTPLTPDRRLRSALADLASHRIRFPATQLAPEELDRHWRRCLRFRPAWLYGYASLLHLLAEHVERRGWDGRAAGIRLVVPTAEGLSPVQREAVRRVFGAPVQNEYGCGELGVMAYDCPRGGLHLMTETTLVEVLDDEGREAEPGVTGEVVVTDLVNTHTPLIRYRLGDRASKAAAPCSCGRGFRTLASVDGRIQDVVYTPLGRRWHGERIDYVLSRQWKELGGFRQFQVVQTGPATLEVRLVSDEPLAPVLQERIRAEVAEQLDGMEAVVRRVDAVEREPNGKLRTVRNDWIRAHDPARQPADTTK